MVSMAGWTRRRSPSDATRGQGPPASPAVPVQVTSRIALNLSGDCFVPRRNGGAGTMVSVIGCLDRAFLDASQDRAHQHRQRSPRGFGREDPESVGKPLEFQVTGDESRNLTIGSTRVVHEFPSRGRYRSFGESSVMRAVSGRSWWRIKRGRSLLVSPVDTTRRVAMTGQPRA